MMKRIFVKLVSNKAFGAVFINVAVLAILLLLFFPVEKLDDYNMKFCLAGAASGYSDAHIVYSNYYLGLLLRNLSVIFPNISWYETTQYIALFLAFSVVTWWVLRRQEGGMDYAVLLLLLFVFGYECYIKLTFTKTAGIVSAVGMLLLYDLFFYPGCNLIAAVGKGVLSFFLLLMGTSLRYKEWELIFAFSLLIPFFRIMPSFLDRSCSWAEKRQSVTRHRAKAILFCLVMAALFVSFRFYNQFGNEAFKDDKAWSEYKTWNASKKELQDYGWPDYHEHYEEFQDLGVSENDYLLWKNRNYTEDGILNEEILRGIIALKQGETVSFLEAFGSFLKETAGIFMEEYTIYPFLFILLLLFLRDGRYKLLFSAVLCLVLTGVMFYFYWSGRYAQHHVDMSIWFMAALMALDFAGKPVGLSERRVLPVLVCFFALFVNHNYSDMLSDSYYGVSGNPKAKEAVTLMSSDLRHMYVTEHSEQRYTVQAYGMFEAIPRGAYHNIYSLQNYRVPSYNVVLNHYQVTNLYQEMVNSGSILYYKSKKNSANSLPYLTEYIREHYDPGVKCQLVKDVLGVEVYCFYNDALTLHEAAFADNLEGICADMYLYQDGNGIWTLDGNAYKQGSNSYASSGYVVLEDEASGTCSYIPVIQSDNGGRWENEGGRFGHFSFTFQEIPLDIGAVDIHFLLQDETGETYRIPVTVR